MRLRNRKRLSLLVLVLGLPAYVLVATAIMAALERPPLWLELLVYVALGILWALPFRRLFLGIGRDEPERPGNGEGP